MARAIHNTKGQYMKFRLAVAIVGAVFPFFLWPGTLFGLLLSGLFLVAVVMMAREHVNKGD